MVLLLNASELLETEKKKRVNKFGGKEKTQREKGGHVTSTKETRGISVLLYREKKDN